MSTRTRGNKGRSTYTLFSVVAKPTVKTTTVTPTKTVGIGQVSAGYEPPTPRVIRHKGWAEDSIVQLYVNMAWEISGGDWDFIYTLEAEGGYDNPHKQSKVPDNRPGMGYNGFEDSWGFCQLHRRRHSKVVDDPRFWESPKRQLEQCWDKYKNGTRFYGYDVRHKVKDRFILID